MFVELYHSIWLCLHAPERLSVCVYGGDFAVTLSAGCIAMPVGGVKWLSLWVYHWTNSFKTADSFRNTRSKYPCKWVMELFTQPICFIKGIVHPKMKMWYLSAYPQGIQDVGDFVSSVEHKRRVLTQTVAVCQSYNAVNGTHGFEKNKNIHRQNQIKPCGSWRYIEVHYRHLSLKWTIDTPN